MLARVLAAMFAIEAAPYTAFVWWRLSRGTSLWVSLLLVLLSLLLVRAAVVAMMFACAWRWRMDRAPGQRLRIWAALRLVLAEYATLFACYCLLQPCEKWLMPREREGAVPLGRPVILVHGFFCNRGYWWQLCHALQRAGLAPVYTINLEPLLAGMKQYVCQLDDLVERICVVSGATQVILVAHSMGGLVARAYARSNTGRARVAAILTLGSPHHGTQLARLLPGHNLTQMLPGSAWLAALEKKEMESPGAPIISLYSAHDNIVAPQDSARLASAENICLPGIGHLELAFNPRVQRLLIDRLRNWQRAMDISQTTPPAAKMPS
ncbi:MAG: alpha/beta fold hydrolase [Candidatus Hydrogenedentes bacterium]|nr:alpha/beta fold hydrolase [Candidatus Hydrogenedentota bacterium]